jgi:hypothetical protein
MPGPNLSSSRPVPKRVYAYVAILFCLAVLDVLGIVNTLDSDFAIIRELTQLRLAAFGLAAFCFATAAVLLWRGIAIGRMLVIVALLAHSAYMLYYNTLILFENGQPSPIEVVGLLIPIGTVFAVFIVVAIIPFTPKFSNYLASKSQS